MKKIICAIAAAALCGTHVSAAVLTAAYEYNPASNGFVISGESDDSMAGDEVTVEAYINNKLFDCAVTETYSENGKILYKSDMIYVDSSKESGTIEFKVTSANSTEAVKTDGFAYYGAADVYSVLKEIDSSLSAKDYGNFITLLSDNEDKLGVNAAALKGAATGTEEAIKKYALEIVFDLPANCDTKENEKKVFEQLLKFRGEVENLNMISAFSSATSSKEFEVAYKKYSSLLDFSQYGEKVKYLNNNYQTDKFFTIIKSKPIAYATLAELQDRLVECGALSEIANGNASSVNNIFTDFSDKFVLKSPVSNIEKSIIFSKMAGNTYSTYSDAADAYNNLASQPNNTGGNTGSTGSGGSKNNGSSVIIPPENTADSSVFSDMSGAEWAKTAVETLYKKGIIAGKTETEFCPNDDITRAEFAKLLVMCKNALVIDEKQYFKDVDSSAWYFNYVNSAFRINAVKGDDNGNFNPNSKITRQDMAVMIYGAMNMQAAESAAFSDNDEISNYAKDAVGTLYSKGIISGVGDGKFAPKSYATRAQAAQIIYKLLIG